MKIKDFDLKPGSIIAVDLDGTLCEGRFWDEECTPIISRIRAINDLYKKGYKIIIHTARHRDYYKETEAWLIKNGVYYTCLSMGKLTADLYIDDRAMNILELI